eukprot:1736219-Pyramimonas_sp.AAC.1
MGGDYLADACKYNALCLLRLLLFSFVVRTSRADWSALRSFGCPPDVIVRSLLFMQRKAQQRRRSNLPS